MPKRSPGSESLTFATVACAYCIRNTLADFPALNEARPFSIVVRVPPDLSRDLARTAMFFAMVFPDVEPFDVVEPFRSLKGGIKFDEVYATLKLSTRVLIIVPDDIALPRPIIAGVDAVLLAKAFDAEMLAQAVSLAHQQNFPIDDLEKMLAYPITEVLAAIRPGRTPEAVLARLEAATLSAPSDDDIPRIEELSGYGAASDWARELVFDLTDWKQRTIFWRDVDGLLLSGPPGVGKTMFARSLAKSAGAEFVASSLAQWQACGHLGDLLAAMRATFNDAATKAPCILLIDEVDAIGDRTSFQGHGASYHTQVVAALLEHLDGTRRREGIVVIGACNHPDQIDSALLRPGRLGTHIQIGLPDRMGLEGILKTHLGSALTEAEIASFAEECDGFTGAEVADLVKNARRRSRRRAGPLSVDDLRVELPPVIPITGEFRQRICIHEAGHVLVALALDVGKLAGVVIRDAIRSKLPIGGAAVFEAGARLSTTQLFLDTVAVQLAGMAAEAVFFDEHLEGSGGEGEGNDLQRAADVATAMVAHFGMGGVLSHHKARHADDRERIRRSLPGVSRRVEAILVEQFDRAKDIVDNNRDFIGELAAVLNEEGAVDGDRARALFNARRNPDGV